jgi:PAS domain S-box-containing protein
MVEIKTRLNQAEKALKSARDEMELIFENISPGIRVINADYTIRMTNRAFSDMSGVTPVEATGKKCWQVFHSPFCQTPECRLSRILNGEGKIHAEIERTRLDGSKVLCIVTAIPMRNEDGKLVGIIELFRDITEKRQMQAHITESEEQYRTLVELGANVGEAIIMLQDIEGKEGLHAYVSDKWTDITGYTRAELLNISFFDLVSPKDREASLNRHRQRMLGHPMPGLFEISITRKDRTEVPIELTSAITSHQGYVANVIYIRDITERKRNDRISHSSEERSQRVIETAMDGFWITDLSGRILQVNDSYCQMSGYKREELMAMYIQDLEATEKPGDTIEHIKNVVIRGKDRFETRHKCKDGRLIDIEVGAKYLSTDSGQLIIFARDITERKHVEEELKEYQEHLEEMVKQRTLQLNISNERLNQEVERRKIIEASLRKNQGELKEQIKQRVQFTRALVHELNTFLTPLIAASEILQIKTTRQKLFPLSCTISSSVSALEHRVTELLDMARGEVGLIELRCSWVELGDLLHDIASKAVYEAERNGQILRLEFAEPLPSIWADQDRLTQILLNLVNNACRYTPKGGTVTIRAFEKRNHVFITIADSGVGLNSDQIEHLFEPYRSIKEKGRSISGLGLGLPLAKMLADLHGGKIDVESKKGSGSAFRLTLPVYTKPQKSQKGSLK